MIRSALILTGIVVLIVLSIGFLGDHGTASLNWMHYRVDTTATTGVILIGVMTFVAVSFWNVVLWLARSPQREARQRAEQHRRQADEAVTRGFIAVASGDGADARRLAAKAVGLSDNVPLTRILGAFAAEESGDATAIHAAYTDMLEVPELRLAGLRGLTQLAQAQGDTTEAVRLATEAYAQTRPCHWAFRTLFQARLKAGEWASALELVEGALGRKIITPVYADRARVALMSATAAKLEAEGADAALDTAVRATKLSHAFTPAPVIAARLLQASGKTARAEDVLEAAWSAHPHPAIAIAYRDLRKTETPRERAERLAALIAHNPEDRESRLLQIERATLLGDGADIARAMSALEADTADGVVTRRVCGLMAKAALALKDTQTANQWIAKGAQSRAEPEWSDIDADGKAFAYSEADWAGVILGYAESGVLAHPRLERADKSLPELPDMPKVYVPSMPFVKASRKPATPHAPLPDAPLPDAEDSFGDAVAGHDTEDAPTTPAPRTPRRKKPSA